MGRLLLAVVALVYKSCGLVGIGFGGSGVVTGRNLWPSGGRLCWAVVLLSTCSHVAYGCLLCRRSLVPWPTHVGLGTSLTPFGVHLSVCVSGVFVVSPPSVVCEEWCSCLVRVVVVPVH